MIDLYYWTTTNPHKVVIFLEEAGVPYRVIPVNISKGEQFRPEFLRLSPNNKVPVIVDDEPPGGGDPVSVFESGAILLYLARKYRKFLPEDLRGRYDVLQWLFWQNGGLGPMAGQNHHFTVYAPEKVPYAIDRFVAETARLYGVLDRQLARHEYIAGEYSIADMAAYPWVVPHTRSSQSLETFPNVRRWFAAMQAKPAAQKAYALSEQVSTDPIVTDEARPILFGQTAATARELSTQK